MSIRSALRVDGEDPSQVAKLRARLDQAADAFDRGEHNRSLELYSSLVNDHREGLVDFPLPEIAKCHLNIAAILLSAEQWRLCSQRCVLLLESFRSCLSEHQIIRVSYFSCVCAMQLKDIKCGRMHIDELYKLVRRRRQTLDEEEVEEYRDLERVLTDLEGQEACRIYKQLAQLIETGSFPQAGELLDSASSRLGRVPPALHCYFRIGRARIHASLGNIDEAVSQYKLCATDEHIGAVEREVLQVTIANLLSLSECSRHKEDAGHFFAASLRIRHNTDNLSEVEIACHRSTRAYALLKCGEKYLQNSDSESAVVAFSRVLALLKDCASSGVWAKWLTPVNCKCSFCSLGDSSTLQDRFIRHESGTYLHQIGSTELCSVLSLCGWREVRATEVGTLMAAYVFLWRCFGSMSEDTLSSLYGEDVKVTRETLWSGICTLISQGDFWVDLCNAPGFRQDDRADPIARVVGSSFKQLSSYINLLSIRALYPVAENHKCDQNNEKVAYDTLFADTSRVVAFVAQLISGRKRLKERTASRETYREFLKEFTLVDTMARYIFSLVNGLQFHLQLKPFDVITGKPRMILHDSSSYLHCDFTNASYDTIWENCIVLISKSIDVLTGLLGNTEKTVTEDHYAHESGAEFASWRLSAAGAIAQATCDLMTISLKLQYSLGIVVWHHEEWGLPRSVRHFDAALDLHMATERLKRQHHIKGAAKPAADLDSIMVGEIYFHLAHAIVAIGSPQCLVEANDAIDKCLAQYDRVISDERIRRKHAWSLKCIVSGMMRDYAGAQSCLDEVSRLVLPPLEDPAAEISGLQQKLNSFMPDLFSAPNVRKNIAPHATDDRGKAILEKLSEERQRRIRKNIRIDEEKAHDSEVDTSGVKKDFLNWMKKCDTDLVIAYTVISAAGTVLIAAIVIMWFA